MPKTLAQLLQNAIDAELPHLHAVMESEAGVRASPGWSRKEELGHLIDSAANNHQRFVRAALEPDYHGLSYDQNGWVITNGYQQLPWADLVELWGRYNGLLAHMIGGIPESKLATECRIGDGAPVRLQFVIEDYVVHMQHHIDHILRREKITQYPQKG